ncbi:MAG: putative cobaltochelatase [Pseudomonadota bacterium]
MPNKKSQSQAAVYDLRSPVQDLRFMVHGSQCTNPASSSTSHPIFPFTAIVGQENLKQSLLLNAVNPRIGGVLIRGEKGTAKSTLVRGLAALLPEIEVVRGCSFSCSPEAGAPRCPDCASRYPHLQVGRRRIRVVDLPLNATEDRVAGGIDFSRSLREGRGIFSPGLLAVAHRGILYVDEVNLLDDHLVDIILDAAASGENRLEREGISFHHPARFVLVGTMNPEEGELRPQLLDRFGLCIEVAGVRNPEDRVRLMRRRDAFDGDPAGFLDRFRPETALLSRQIAEARMLLPRVRISDALRGFIGELGRENHVAGHRADLVMEQAALALAALNGQTAVGVDHIRQVAPMVLIHRRRDVQPPPPEQDKPQDEAPGEPETQEASTPPDPQPQAESESPTPKNGPEENRQSPPASRPKTENPEEQLFQIGATFKVKPLASVKDRIFRRGSGRRSRSRISQKKGRYVKSTLRDNGDIALDATLRAAAPFQKQRQCADGLAVHLTRQDLRGKVREKRIGNFLLFVVDASGSMGARGRMAASKGAVMSLLLDAYQKRDRVALISFRRTEAFVNLPPTSSVELAGKLLAEMPVGGRTPLSAGLAKSHEQVRNYLIKNPTAQPIVIFITDGKSNVALGNRKPVEESLRLATAMTRDRRSRYIVVDTEEAGMVSFGLARRLAMAMEAQYFKIDELKAEALVNIVEGHAL